MFMVGLFDENLEGNIRENAPLADRMRPVDFDSFFGQDELIGEKSSLRKVIQNDALPSIIFWGPPGSGKTTLSKIIAHKTESFFVEFSAVMASINDVRKAIAKAKEDLKFNKKKTIIFIDEIHRFNKAQQDALLPSVEQGIVTLIGATTENPSFEVISPLLSRSIVYILKPLSDQALKNILIRALEDKKDGLANFNLKFTDRGLSRLIVFADGDARAGLNALEFISNSLRGKSKTTIGFDEVLEILKEHSLRYDKRGEEHYNLISALHKSMRDSNPDAALYWLMRMLEAGEDPKFIIRRMINFASEDIGNADPEAIQLVVAIARAIEYTGMPEAKINLSQAAIYLSLAPKNNAVYIAMRAAQEDAKKGSFGVPLHLRNPETDLMKKIGYGKGYEYAPNLPNKKSDQTHFPKEIGQKKYYNPESNFLEEYRGANKMKSE